MAKKGSPSSSSSSSNSNSHHNKRSPTSHSTSSSSSTSTTSIKPIKRAGGSRRNANSIYVYPAIFFFLLFSVQLFFPSITDQIIPTYIEKFQQILSQQSKYPPPLRTDINLSTTIKTLTWSAPESSSFSSKEEEYQLIRKEIFENILQFHVPCVIRKGPAMSWPMIQWDMLEFIKSGHDLVMNGIKWQNEPVFILGRDRDPNGMLGLATDRPLQYLNTTLSHFLKTLFNTTEYYYWNGELAWIEEVTGESSTKPESNPLNDWSIFKYIDPKLQDSIHEEDDLWIPMVWLSHPGVVAQTHYDPQHNFLSQIQGVKRVILFPPSETSLYPYPHIHRSYRQSQLRLEKEQNKETNSNSNSNSNSSSYLFPTLPDSGIEVVLHPGDTLYIPPYWYHRVESVTMSISLSVTSPTFEEAQFSEIYWQSLPFGSFANTTEGRMIAAKLFLGLLIHTLERTFHDTLESFSETLFSSRYHPLYSNIQSQEDYPCPAYPTEGSYFHQLIQENSQNFHEVIKKTVEKLKKIRCEKEIKRTLLRDYVEEISRWAVGPEDTVFFIRECLK